MRVVSGIYLQWEIIRGCIIESQKFLEHQISSGVSKLKLKAENKLDAPLSFVKEKNFGMMRVVKFNFSCKCNIKFDED